MAVVIIMGSWGGGSFFVVPLPFLLLSFTLPLTDIFYNNPR